MTNYETTIKEQLKRCRVLFWYDEKGEKRQEFDELWLTDIEKRVVDSNEFSLKYEILRGQPDRKFLLYFPYAEPKPAENWLLDIQLANAIFFDDEIGMWLSELKLDTEMRSLLSQYQAFFKKTENREKFSRRCEDETKINPEVLLRRMAAVCLDSLYESRDELATVMLKDYANGTAAGIKRLEKSEISGPFLNYLGEAFRLDAPKSLDDFATGLFWEEYLYQSGGKTHPNQNVHLLLDRWKKDSDQRTNFRKASRKAAKALEIREKLTQLPKEKLSKVDIFEDAETLWLQSIFTDISAGCVDPSSVEPRDGGPWGDIYGPARIAAHAAAEFYDGILRADLNFYDYETGFQRYATKWYQVDGAFRRFITASVRGDDLPEDVKESLDGIKGKITKAYQNRWLSQLCDAWQKVLDTDFGRSCQAFPLQSGFFSDLLTKNSVMGTMKQKTAVIISDGLRYEAAAELYSRINKDMEGFQASINAMRGVVPSFTQLGMAALLPHKTIELCRDGSAKVDGKSISGIPSRDTILQEQVTDSRALRADVFLSMSSDEKKKTCSGLKCLLLYHNKIDYEGEGTISETKTFEAVDDALDELVKLIKACKNLNFLKIYITADHGFLYNHDKINDTQFPVNDPPKGKADKTETRFMLGDDLDNEPVLMRVPCEDFGYTCETNAYVVRGDLRLHTHGGKRYVHGGAMLQETVIPLLTVSVQKKDDIKKVQVSVVESGSYMITTGVKTIRFFQQEPVSDEVMPRVVTTGFYDADGNAVSDIHELRFDMEENEPRLREITQPFTFSGSSQGQVTLRFIEKVGAQTIPTDMGTYTLRRMVETDF